MTMIINMRKPGLKLLNMLGIAIGSLLLTACSTYSQPTASYENNASQNKTPKVTYQFPETREATGKKVFIFEPQYARYGLYDEEGDLLYQGRASGGKGYCPDTGSACVTPAGTYQIYRKQGAECKSTKFPVGVGGAPMPYCMFFHKGYAVHGSNDVPDRNASHGCIRVTPEDAEWLNEDHLNIGDTVIVRSYSENDETGEEFWEDSEEG
ncbi:MAG: L,D-transpeptidase [Gammaproteobacteria bacterium]|jgi:hypothetical protein|nr:L,D-transpeptidase [Gammaproteobacteria bacterium]